MASRLVIVGLPSYLLRVQDLQILPNMLVGNTRILLQQSEREVKGLSEITTKLKAESKLEFKCLDPQPEMFSTRVSSTSYSIIPSYLPLLPFFPLPAPHLPISI